MGDKFMSVTETKVYSSLSLSIGSKSKLMGDKFMSVAFKTFVRSDGKIIYLYLCFLYIFQRLSVQHFSSYD